MARWKKYCLVGRGSYGSVYLAAPLNNNSFLTGSRVAVKSSNIELSSSLQVEANLLQELRDCPYIIQGLGTDVSTEEGKLIYNLILEYASGGSLDKMIRFYNGNMSETLVACYAFMLLKGLSSIHEREIVHCDFKPANVLVFLPSEEGIINVLKIADFGLSRKVWEADSGRSRCTPVYASPESITCGLIEKSGDIWALGCIVVEMITGRPLGSFKNFHDLIRKIVYEQPKIPDQNVSEEAKEFLKRCLDGDPIKRWTSEMLLNHPFITNNLSAAGMNHLRSLQEVVGVPKKSWSYTNGVFSTPLKLQVGLDNFKPCELFPQGGSCCGGLSFALPCGEFAGRIY